MSVHGGELLKGIKIDRFINKTREMCAFVNGWLKYKYSDTVFTSIFCVAGLLDSVLLVTLKAVFSSKNYSKKGFCSITALFHYIWRCQLLSPGGLFFLLCRELTGSALD